MRQMTGVTAGVWMATAGGGCRRGEASTGELELVWGRRGITKGRMHKPRAMAIDAEDLLYIVDMTARIQVFTRDGEYVRGWQTPEFKNGKPSGLTFANDGNLLVADTHYFRVLVYTPLGELLEDRTIGGVCGHGPGEFNFVTDALQDSAGNYYVAEYGEYDRVQKFSPERDFLYQWGSHGSEPGQFVRPQNMVIDKQDQIWVADACNHRIQIFDVTGDSAKLVRMWGEEGVEPGQIRYPYDLVLDGREHLYLCEFGNHRVQKFTLDGQFVAAWGVGGRREGELNQPWSLVIDSHGRTHVLDTYNHRVQRILL
ncbi:MAG: hypothetical protein KDA47_11650 [Planctomycetales bacterium]|nr:hypothetical protein [Planctomycetales bacterium]